MTSKIVLGLVVALFLAAFASDAAHAQTCGSTDYTYTFTNDCAYPVWIAQYNGNETSGHQPQGDNWALANSCQTSADCLSGSQCSDGQCSCTSSTDCPGGASCNSGLCSTTDVFCMPQAWTSGRFWPRTGCSGSGSTLNCATGQCGGSGDGALDCTAAKATGDNPSTLFEVTSITGGTANYDVSMVDGGNVSLRAEPIDANPGTGCIAGGCVSDLNRTCPADLQITTPAGDAPTAIPCGSGKYCPEGTCVSNAGTPTCVIGCVAPCDQCQQSSPPAGLKCTDEIGSSYTACDKSSQQATYEDLYCTKSFHDGNSMASGNQGTPTCFSNLDCPPGSICYGIGKNPAAPAAGVCINPRSPANNGTCFQNLTTGPCSATNVGEPCGGYMEFFSDALGYTCQAVKYKYKGVENTTYACLPPTTTGLGTCEVATPPKAGTCGIGSPPPTQAPLYTGTGSPANADFVTAATQAGGGSEPYYAIFKRACPRAYSWSYDDASGGLACTGGLTGFNVVFCPENARRPLGNLGFGLENRIGNLGFGLLGNLGFGLENLEGLGSGDNPYRDFDSHDF
jgi:hypothetical protein